MIIRPQRNFTIVRQIANHLDTATYYVRAVIRDSYTDAILDTLDLADKGGQRFTKNWLVAPDPLGLGRDISIVTSVYTDAGYTTKSENYGDEENTYLIEENSSHGKGGGSGVDARTVRRIIQEEIANIPKPEKVEFPKIPKAQEVKFDSVLSAIESLKIALKPEKPEKVDFKPLYDALQSILSAVNEKEVTEPTDLTPVLEAIDAQDTNLTTLRGELLETLDALDTTVLKTVPKEIATLIRGTTFGISLTPTSTPNMKEESEKEEKEEPAPLDLSKLSI